MIKNSLTPHPLKKKSRNQQVTEFSNQIQICEKIVSNSLPKEYKTRYIPSAMSSICVRFKINYHCGKKCKYTQGKFCSIHDGNTRTPKQTYDTTHCYLQHLGSDHTQWHRNLSHTQVSNTSHSEWIKNF